MELQKWCGSVEEDGAQPSAEYLHHSHSYDQDADPYADMLSDDDSYLYCTHQTVCGPHLSNSAYRDYILRAQVKREV